MLMGGYHIAVVGATGAAGTELLRVLERRSFPVASLRPIGSARSVGKSVQFCGDSIPVEKLDAGSFEKIDIAFFSAGGDVSRNYVPIACQADAIAIDKSSAFRMDPHVPLVIPEINAEDVKLHRGIIANPNCTTTVMLMALYPLHKIFRVHRVFAATYQAVSGSGTRGVEELTRQTRTWSEDEQLVAVSLWPTWKKQVRINRVTPPATDSDRLQFFRTRSPSTCCHMSILSWKAVTPRKK